MPKRLPIDWKMTLGFGGLLLLIMAIGFIGIQQIQELGGVVAQLVETEIPMQKAVLEMKSSNIKYAIAIRNYVSLLRDPKVTKEAVKEKLYLIRQTPKEFDSNLVSYASLATEGHSQEWVKTAQLYESDLRRLGENIIVGAEGLAGKTGESDKKKEEVINQDLTNFEGQLAWFDTFLSQPIKKFDSPKIARQLVWAEVGRRRSVTFLGWSILIGLFLGLQTAFLIYRRSKMESEHRELLWRKVITLEEQERNNLSLQIHDQMGQDLSALKIFLALLDKDLPLENREQKEKVEKAKKILDELMDKTHNISELLRPPELDELGLVESLSGLIFKYKEMTGANYNYLKPSQDLILPPEDCLVLYRVVQEALTNIAKYSLAKNVEINLIKRNNDVHLIIADDGVGFDVDAYAHKPTRRKDDKAKLGLQGLKERLELLGGSLRIYSKSNQGTRLEVVLPTG